MIIMCFLVIFILGFDLTELSMIIVLLFIPVFVFLSICFWTIIVLFDI